MPIYEYICHDCGQAFELLVRSDEKPICPSCGTGKLAKQLSVPAPPATVSPADRCPARESCGAPNCRGNSCGMAQWMG
ncbi:MAG: FmdB family zinc ribbon protein [Thermoguttaceae bacterium]